MNQYPLWKYLLILGMVVIALVYSAPNLYEDDLAIQISSVQSKNVDDFTLLRVTGLLDEEDIPYKGAELQDGKLIVRVGNSETQLKAKDVIKEELGRNFVVAFYLAPSIPDWLKLFNAAPMYLGLDLRGGVHFLLEVDMEAAIKQTGERYVSDMRSLMRGEKIRYRSIAEIGNGAVEIKLASPEARENAKEIIRKEFPNLELNTQDREGAFFIRSSLNDNEKRDIRRNAIQQNIKILRNRVNELGVAEPIVQQQGANRIVVQLPGVQDTARAKEILGATATLEYRLQYTGDASSATEGNAPVGSKLYKTRDGQSILLSRSIIITGQSVIDAASGIDQQSGSPAVFVTLDSQGAKRMGDTTKENVGKPMAVVFIENKVETKIIDGKPVKIREKVEEVISVANIREPFSKRFQTTGIGSTEEARNLALLLRAGALATPIEIVEERTVGPSLGQDNIDQGFNAVVIGFILVLIIMAVYYRIFGLVANIALALNLVFIVAVLSLLQATLTLPGIAGIVLTVGMAVDANVLIFERIREELQNGNTPQASINAGYKKALSTIADANVTTLIAALVLFGFGTGPIKGFAVTLSIGIITSMFTAIMGTRAVINIAYGGRRVEKLSI